MSQREGQDKMTLRIQKLEDSDMVVFKLTGRIQAEDVPELLALLKSVSRERGIVLDLEQVKLVDRDAVLFLATREAVGIRLRNCSAYIREWIDQERKVLRKTETEDPTGFAE